MSVGANIRRRRFELRMTQQELADAMGYKTRSTIAKIESGENDVSQKKLIRFAEALDTTMEALIFGKAVVRDEFNGTIESNRKQTNKNVVVILAGGKSGRNRQNIPSQFIDIYGKPVIVYCMEVYQSHPMIDDIYVVCLKGWEHIVNAYAEQYGITKLRGLITAGGSGVLSLKKAVEYVKETCLPQDNLIIQEATRPMIRPETISQIIQAVGETGSATICHSMNEYVQFDVSGEKAKYVDRNSIIALQSPEIHKFSILTELFEKADCLHHPLNESCCTMLLYNLGYDINFIRSNINNIKITYEEDIAAFTAMIKDR